MILRLGIDIAVRAPHQASLADERGQLLWSGHRFRTTAADLERLWERLPTDHLPENLTVVMEPTRKIVSSVIGVFEAMSASPCPEKNSRDPSRTTPTARPTAGRRFAISRTLVCS